MFVDCRVHISVRPYAEYTIPTIGHYVCAVLTGDMTYEDFEKTVQKYTPTPPTHAAVLCDGVDGKLYSLCTHVVLLTKMYLTNIEQSWRKFINRLQAGIHCDLTHIDAEVQLARHEGTDTRRRMSGLHTRL